MRRRPRYCECGNLITRKFARYCDKCGTARMAHGGLVSIMIYNNLKKLEAERKTTYQTILVKAKCLKCPTGHDIHYIELRRDPGRMLFEFCKHHKGLRQMDYFPACAISPDIRIRA